MRKPKKQEIKKQGCLIGETVPIWIVFGLLSLGLFASVSTSWMLLPSESQRDVWASRPSPEKSASSKLPSDAEVTVERESAAEAGRTDRMRREATVQQLVTAMTELGNAGENMEDNAGVVTPPSPEPAEESSPAVVEAKTAEKVTGTSVLAGAADIRDCPPLFTVRFESGDVRPLDSDLMEKIDRDQQSFLTRAGRRIMPVEGFLNSYST